MKQRTWFLGVLLASVLGVMGCGKSPTALDFDFSTEEEATALNISVIPGALPAGVPLVAGLPRYDWQSQRAPETFNALFVRGEGVDQANLAYRGNDRVAVRGATPFQGVRQYWFRGHQDTAEHMTGGVYDGGTVVAMRFDGRPSEGSCYDRIYNGNVGLYYEVEVDGNTEQIFWGDFLNSACDVTFDFSGMPVEYRPRHLTKMWFVVVSPLASESRLAIRWTVRHSDVIVQGRSGRYYQITPGGDSNVFMTVSPPS